MSPLNGHAPIYTPEPEPWEEWGEPKPPSPWLARYICLFFAVVVCLVVLMVKLG